MTDDRDADRDGAPAPASPACAFGVDVGATGIKAAVVELTDGGIVGVRHKARTPRPATPDAVAGAVAKIVADAGWCGPVGVTLPMVVRGGVAMSAANVDRSWIGTDVRQLFKTALGSDHLPIVLNDADAAGLAEARVGVAAGRPGVVLLLTFGTGIGSALVVDGRLVPNTELGHLELDGHDAETRAAASVRDLHGMSYARWAARVTRYLNHLERLFSPDLFVLSGGISRMSERWMPHLEVSTPVEVAQLRETAEMVGAAFAAVSL